MFINKNKNIQVQSLLVFLINSFKNNFKIDYSQKSSKIDQNHMLDGILVNKNLIFRLGDKSIKLGQL
jgi:hypothetical protein